MNRNIIIGIVVVLFIAVGAGIFMMMGKSKDSLQNSTAQKEQTTSESRSFKELISLGTDQKCEFVDTENGNSGTVYMADGNVRGDFTSNINGKATRSHMVLDRNAAYIWMDNETSGFKMSRSSIEDMQEKLPGSGEQQSVDVNKKVDYKCSSWSPDNSLFAPPSNVEFKDYTKMMEDASKMMGTSGTPGASGGNPACSACENLTGESQVQCKAALKCN